MSTFDAQNTDRENAKSAPKTVVRDNDLKQNGKGGLQDIARAEQPEPLKTRVEPFPTVK